MKRSKWLVLLAVLYLTTLGVCFGDAAKQTTATPAAQAEMEQNKGEQQRLERRLAEIGKKLDELEAKVKTKAQTKKEEAKADYRKEIASLRKQQKGLKKKLRELGKASGKAWKDLKTGAEAAMDELEKGYQKAVKQFQ